MEDLYARLHDDVLSGALDPGEPLVETALAQRYGVSRTPVRDALNRLEHDGFVERRDRSLRVRTRTPTEILEIYEVRISLETLAARQACEHRTEWDLRRLRSAHEAMTALAGPEPGAMAANRRFHEAVWGAGHNAVLVDLLHRLHDHLRRYPETTLASPGRWEQVLDDHRRITELIEDRDSTAAGQLAERHMQAARDIRLEMFARDDD